MKLTKELFVIPGKKDEFILYAPLKGAVISVNSGTVGLLRTLDKSTTLDARLRPLQDIGIIIETEESILDSKEKDFKPTSVTIMPTTDCNLRCIYCYGNGGVESTYIKEELAIASIDLILRNALDLKKKQIGVSFHGGGEPLYLKTFDIVRNAIDYAKREAAKNNLSTKIYSATNGILNDSQRKWIKENIDSLTLSFDGLPEYQDKQRPTVSGKGSYKYLEKSINFFDESNMNYVFRSTITADSVGDMAKMVEFVAENTGCKRLHMEPLYECGRCVTSKKKSPEPEKFLRNLILAREAGKKLGIEIVFSSGNLKELRNKYCGAAGNNFCITQDGFVTSCYEVMRQSDPRSIHFFYGKFNEDKKQFEFDEKKRKVLASREVRNLPYCRDCFAKFNCGGECLAKVASSKDLFSPCNYDSKCTINRGILLSQLEGVLTEQGEKNG